MTLRLTSSSSAFTTIWLGIHYTEERRDSTVYTPSLAAGGVKTHMNSHFDTHLLDATTLTALPPLVKGARLLHQQPRMSVGSRKILVLALSLAYFLVLGKAEREGTRNWQVLSYTLGLKVFQLSSSFSEGS